MKAKHLFYGFLLFCFSTEVYANKGGNNLNPILAEESELEDGDDCFIEYTGSYEAAIGNLNNLMYADDFVVADGVDMTIQTLTVDILAERESFGVATILGIYKNDDGMPGAEIAVFSNVTPVSKTLVGTALGLDIYESVFEFPTEIELSSGVYWFSLLVSEGEGEGGGNYLSTADSLNGSFPYHSFDGGDTWEPSIFSLDLAFRIDGVCEGEPIDPEPTDLTCEDNFVASNNFQDGSLFGGDSNQEMAFDIIVGDEGFTTYGIQMNVLVVGNTNLEFSVTVYNDENGLPGSVYNNNGNGTVVSAELLGNIYGFDVYTYLVKFDSPIIFDANSTYWMQVDSNAFAWEITSTGVFGSRMASFNDYTNGQWEIDYGFDVVYSLVCEESELNINELNAFDFAYYPNPVKDVLNINSQKPVKNVDVFNLTGQRVMSNSTVSQGQLDTSNLPAGIYVFRVTLEGGQVESFKILKK